MPFLQFIYFYPSYSLLTTELLNWMMQMLCSLETNAISLIGVYIFFLQLLVDDDGFIELDGADAVLSGDQCHLFGEDF